MAINFPDAPTTGDEFTSGDRTWKWDGTTWENVGAGFTATSPVVLTGADFSFDSTSIQTNAANIATNVTDIQTNADAIAVNVTDIQTNADAIASLEVADITDLTATAAELNILDGVTATTAELNFSDGVTSAIQTQVDAQIPKNTVTTSQDLIVADGASSVTRLGVGTDDQVLSVVDGEVAWADAGGGSRTLLGTVTLTGSSVTFTSIPAGYQDLHIRVDNFRISSQTSMGMKFNSHSNYRNGGWSESNYQNVTFPSSLISWTSIQIQNVNSNAFGYANILNYSSSNTRKFGESHFASQGVNGTLTTNKAVFYSNLEAAITSIEITPSSGTFTSGTIKLYGVK